MLGPLELLMIGFAVAAVFVAVVGIPTVKALRPLVIHALKAWRQKQAAKTEIATLPPAGRVLNQQWETIDARPYRPEPIQIVVDQQGKKGGGFGKLVVIALCIAYIVFPVDVLPDFIPVIGWADDFVAAIIGLNALLK